MEKTPDVEPTTEVQKPDTNGTTETNGTQPPQQSLTSQAMSDLENELSPWTRDFLKKHKTANDAIALTDEEKKEFVKNYYVADNLYQDRLEKMVDEAEETIDNILSEEVKDEASRYNEKFLMA